MGLLLLVDHVVPLCPTHLPPHGLDGLPVLDVETIPGLLNIFPEV